MCERKTLWGEKGIFSSSIDQNFVDSLRRLVGQKSEHCVENQTVAHHL